MSDMKEMRHLVVCCDGTGNLWRENAGQTNVARLFAALRTEDGHGVTQLRYYDPGVGTPDGEVSDDSVPGMALGDRLSRLAGLAFGNGVWENVAQAYAFLMRSWQPGNRVFLFGFSRGAFTVRAVAGMIHLFGLLLPEHENMLPTLLRVYRMADTSGRDQLAKSLSAQFSWPESNAVHFIGVWDTVESLGIWQILGWGTRITSEPQVKSSYVHVCHAVALDEMRWPFTPRLYQEAIPEGEQPKTHSPELHQVGFRGAHSDVGGGYGRGEDGLSNVALHWMAGHARRCGLRLDSHMLEAYRADPFGTIHSQAMAVPVWALLGLAGRRLGGVPLALHESVIERYRALGPEGLMLPVCPSVELQDSRMPQVAADHHAEQLRQQVGLWAWLCGVVALLAAAGLLWVGGQPAWDLAMDLQLGLARDDWWALGQALDKKVVGLLGLLRLDFLLIVVMLAVIVLVSLCLHDRVAYRRRVPAVLGPWAGRAAVGLPVAAVLENLGTLAAWQSYRMKDAPGGCGEALWSCDVVQALLSAGVMLCSALKLGCLAVLVVVMLVHLWAMLRPVPRLPVQGSAQVRRPARWWTRFHRHAA